MDLEPVVTMPWLVRLRWAFLLGQVALLPVGLGWFHLPFDPVPIAIELVLLTVSNVVLQRRRWRGARAIGTVMLLDTVILTLLLAGSGGSANPFTVLYLVHVTLAAIVLDARWITAIVAASLTGFGTLFARGSPHMMHMSLHLEMMWIAFAAAALLIAFFVVRVTRAIAGQREQIVAQREQIERAERLASVTRLAAGAAHELGSPLATIAVAAHEARRRNPPAAIASDLDLILEEVERCQEILSHLSTRAGDAYDELSLADLASAIRDHLDATDALRVDVAVDHQPGAITAPREQLVQTICALVDNALDATDDRVSVKLSRATDQLEILIRDRGDGIPADVLAQIGSPFFTTKGTGRGLGLGVFLARAFCESRGGTLTIASERGRGTSAAIRIPIGGAA